MELAKDQSLGQYRIVDKIGEGGMGAVYRAEQPSIVRTVVIKVLGSMFAEAPDARDRFRRELDMITRLEHPHILPVYDFGEVEGSPYIVMRFMTGGSLQDRLARPGFDRQEALRLLDQVAQALDFAHDRGVVHRDLKPANVLLDELGNAYLADFGLAKTMGGTRDLTTAGSVLGSPSYMSPEQARGEKLDRRSDIYSFAVLVYRVLCGRLPFEAPDAWGYITKHIYEAPAPIRQFAPDLPVGVESVLAGALAKDPAARPARATDLAASLRAAFSGGGPTRIPASASATPAVRTGTGAAQSGTIVGPSAPVAPSIGAPRPASRSRLPTILGIGAVGLLAVGGIGVAAFVLLGGGLIGPSVTSYPVGNSPRAVLLVEDSVFVANFYGNSLTRLDSSCTGTGAGCGELLATYQVDSLPVALAFDGRQLWVAGAQNQTLTAIDPASGRELDRIALPHVPTALLWADSSLWVANAIAGTVSRVSPAGSIEADLDVGAEPVALAFDGSFLWVANQVGREAVRIDPATDRILDRFPLTGEPTAIAYDGRWVWIALTDANEVVALSPDDGAVAHRIDLAAQPSGLWIEGGVLWAASLRDGKVIRIDPARAEVQDTFSVDGTPSSLGSQSCGEGCWDVWITLETSNAVGRLRVR